MIGNARIVYRDRRIGGALIDRIGADAERRPLDHRRRVVKNSGAGYLPRLAGLLGGSFSDLLTPAVIPDALLAPFLLAFGRSFVGSGRTPQLFAAPGGLVVMDTFTLNQEKNPGGGVRLHLAFERTVDLGTATAPKLFPAGGVETSTCPHSFVATFAGRTGMVAKILQVRSYTAHDIPLFEKRFVSIHERHARTFSATPIDDLLKMGKPRKE